MVARTLLRTPTFHVGCAGAALGFNIAKLIAVRPRLASAVPQVSSFIAGHTFVLSVCGAFIALGRRAVLARANLVSGAHGIRGIATGCPVGFALRSAVRMRPALNTVQKEFSDARYTLRRTITRAQ